MNTQSIYMNWAKTRPKVKYDLALSGILNLPFAELEAKIEGLCGVIIDTQTRR